MLQISTNALLENIVYLEVAPIPLEISRVHVLQATFCHPTSNVALVSIRLKAKVLTGFLLDKQSGY